jgi:hypothetical protein
MFEDRASSTGFEAGELHVPEAIEVDPYSAVVARERRVEDDGLDDACTALEAR